MEAKISEISENNGLYKFTLTNLNVSIANALRRTIMSEIPCVVFRTETFETNQCTFIKNTTRQHNEILKQRLSCIPVHMSYKDIHVLPDKYMLEVHVKNDSDEMKFVTTEDFKIKNKMTPDKEIDATEIKKIFPPDPLTNEYIDFARLRPKISNSIPGEEIHLTCEFSISNAKENSMFNVVSKCAYGNSIDLEKVNSEWEKYEAQLRSQELSKEEIEFHKKNFYILDAQRHFKEDSFDFVLKSIGFYENKEIPKIACKILIDKFKKLDELLESKSINIFASEVAMEYSYDITLYDEDYTVGKVLEYLLYQKYFDTTNKADKILSFCGFQKKHPHDDFSIIRIAFINIADKAMVESCLKNAIDSSEIIFKGLYNIL